MGYKKIIAYMVILAGMVTFLIPLYEQGYSWYWQKKLVKQWEDEAQVDASHQEVEAARSYLGLSEVFPARVELTNDEPFVDVEASDHSAVADKNMPEKMEQGQVLGMIEIDKIDLQLPVAYGSDLETLKKTAGLLEGTAMLGETGNSAIAAHRSYTYGKFFNRLNEIEEGDTITIETNSGIYEYEVYKILVVEPTDLSVLEQTDEKKIITLITCDPIDEATHRLIVHAEEV